jgi:hypothetical protein
MIDAPQQSGPNMEVLDTIKKSKGEGKNAHKVCRGNHYGLKQTRLAFTR